MIDLVAEPAQVQGGSPGRRWPRILAAAALLVLLTLGLAVVLAFDRVPRDDVESVPPGTLTVAPTAVGTWSQPVKTPEICSRTPSSVAERTSWSTRSHRCRVSGQK